MAGHSKWKKIKHKKALNDKKRGASFTKLIKEITVAARHGGGDPKGNPRLNTLLEKAREGNMPIEHTQRAIKRGTGELPGVVYEHIMYEGYGPNGIAVLVEVLTDNRNKAVAELRTAFTRNGGTLGESNSVAWMFERVGEIQATLRHTQGDRVMSEDELLEKLLDYDIKNITTDDGIATIHTEPKILDQVRQAVINLGLKVESSELEWIAKNPVELDEAKQNQVIEFLEAIEDLDDTQNVYTTMA